MHGLCFDDMMNIFFFFIFLDINHLYQKGLKALSSLLIFANHSVKNTLNTRIFRYVKKWLKSDISTEI